MFPGDRYDLQSAKAINKYKYVKGLLLVIASIAFAVIVFWPSIKDYFERSSSTFISEEYKKSIVRQETKSRAKDIRFYGADKSNQPYTLNAEEGDENTSGIVFLTKPQLTLNLKSGNIATLTATDGEYDRNKDLVTLRGEVIVTHSLGYQFVTSLAWIDLTQSVAHGDKPVHGDGPNGIIDSHNGFRLSDNGEKVIFLGRPELILKVRKNP